MCDHKDVEKELFGNTLEVDERYASRAECILDIMANTDAPYRVAVLATKYVYENDWGYDNHPTDPRGVIISPDFDAVGSSITVIYLQQGRHEDGAI